MVRYMYESHTGGIYFDSECLPYEKLFCETCFDCDHLIGKVESLKDCWELIKDNCSIDGSGGWSLQYIYPVLVSEFLLNEEVPYEDYNMKSQGFCSLSDKDIINRIEKFIKQGS